MSIYIFHSIRLISTILLTKCDYHNILKLQRYIIKESIIQQEAVKNAKYSWKCLHYMAHIRLSFAEFRDRQKCLIGGDDRNRILMDKEVLYKIQYSFVVV